MTRPRLVVFVLATISFSNIAIAAEQTYVREYTYQASEVDSKVTARAIALQEVKRELLSELGTHVSSLVKLQSSSDGKQLGTEEIETLSAGVTRVEILDENWNGSVYVLKAQIKADPAEVLNSLNKMLDADKKQKQISQLNGELSKISGEKIQVVESLTQSKKETTAALAEIARLNKQLKEQQTDASRQSLKTAYQKQVNQLTLNDLVDSAVKYYKEGNYPEAFRLFQNAAKQGSAKAQWYLGMSYYKGEGVVRNNKNAVYWIRKSADQGSDVAQVILGYMYAESIIGVARDPKQAAYWWQKAAGQGEATAQFNLGGMYESGHGVARDSKQAVYWYQKAADQDFALAQSSLGWMYLNGDGVARDEKQAMYWFQKAAEQGNPATQNDLGVRYQKGDGVEIDFKQAVYWYQKAADRGDAFAQYNLGVMYHNGYGIESNAKLAVYWYQKAADQGLAPAQNELGWMYTIGYGVDTDAKKGVYWFQKAVKQRFANAQYHLGIMYDTGEGVAHDAKKALYWYQKAAAQGDADALSTIQEKLQNGRVTP